MSKVILLIDDDRDDRELFVEALSTVSSVWSCQCCDHGETALASLKSGEIAKPQVIFLDINLPMMSGWQCLTSLKKDHALKDIPVIMYSTSSHKRDKDIAYELGAKSFITKPSDYKELKHVLSDIITNLDYR